MIDWTKFDLHELRLSLHTLPNIAGPWKQGFKHTWQRHSFDGRESRECAYVGSGPFDRNKYFYVVDGGYCVDCESFEDGRAKCDEELRKLGYSIDDEV